MASRLVSAKRPILVVVCPARMDQSHCPDELQHMDTVNKYEMMILSYLCWIIVSGYGWRVDQVAFLLFNIICWNPFRTKRPVTI